MCKIIGVSCGTVYHYLELADEGGIDALSNRSRRAPYIKIWTFVAIP
ncbi:helix-turn-helix domain-containing protein [Leclercia adecarboxylata]|uniref:Helix-turn-helix domain-containing protein n=1 Tax=Leclercia adecarboxylata TaxID=83655 RepID=A0AAP9DE68_9ENTR|nr:helix-turn-helix domain-containing protein [Leclercia adecarboxylata]